MYPCNSTTPFRKKNHTRTSNVILDHPRKKYVYLSTSLKQDSRRDLLDWSRLWSNHEQAQRRAMLRDGGRSSIITASLLSYCCTIGVPDVDYRGRSSTNYWCINGHFRSK